MKVIIKTNKELVEKAKAVARKNGVNLSFMVENHLRDLLKMPLLKIQNKEK